MEKNQLNISIIKEKIQFEKRVIFTPEQVSQICKYGINVFVESGAGLAVGFSDEMYLKSGAKIVSTEEAWQFSDYIFKYKGPIREEYRYFRKGQTICALFHAEGNEELVKKMQSQEISAFTYEFLETKDGIFPLALPGGEIAGKSAVIHGAYLLQKHFGGKGKMLTSIRGAERATVGVIGYGNVGCSAIKLASEIGANVIVFGKNIAKMKKTLLCFDDNVQCIESCAENYFKYLPKIDLLIGSILISTYGTPALITKEMIAVMQKGSVVIDVTCGYGSGYMPIIKKTTTLENPSYIDNGIVYCKIDNLPAGFPITAVEAFTKNAFPYILNMIFCFNANKLDGLTKSCQILDKGKICHNVIAEHMKFYEKNRL